jgi:hypothetical protein
MKNIFLLQLISLFAISVIFTANASVLDMSPTINFGIAGDTYFATDNDKGVGLYERPLTNTNVFKDRFATNNVLLHASAKGEDWRANVAVATFSGATSGRETIGFIQPEEINAALNIIEGLWIKGGVFSI